MILSFPFRRDVQDDGCFRTAFCPYPETTFGTCSRSDLLANLFLFAFIRVHSRLRIHAECKTGRHRDSQKKPSANLSNPSAPLRFILTPQISAITASVGYLTQTKRGGLRR